MRPRGRGREKEKYRINKDITAPMVRVVSEDGDMLGEMTVSQALLRAEDAGMDLIEVAPNAKPPTCRIMDYGKYKYEQKKKAQASKKKQVQISIKEIQLRPGTEQHDLDVKLRHARRFLESGDKTKVNMRFRGREMAHQEVGRQLLDKVCKALEDIAVVEVPAKMEGRQLFVMLAPDPAKLKEIQKKKKAEQEKKEQERNA